MIFRQLQVTTLVFSFTVLYCKKKLSEKWVLLRFEQKLFAKQENARDRRQLPVSEHNFPTCLEDDFALRYVRIYPGVNSRAELVTLA